MNTFLVVLTCANVVLLLSLSLLLFLKIKEKKEDNRITKGLQLLQHKIAILHDLSDKSDDQVQRLVSILDTKSNEIKKAMKEANSVVQQMNEIAANSINHATHNIEASAATPKTIQEIKPQESSTMDEFTQFIQAINQQNENSKSQVNPMIIEASEGIPQNFESMEEALNESIEPTTTSMTDNRSTSGIRPVEFRRI